MTRTSRWLDELPANSTEGGLLTAGRRARPPEGAAASSWQAFSVVVGVTSLGTSLTSNAIAKSTIATKTANLASAALVKNAAMGGLGISLAAKSVTIGFALGIGILGTGMVAERAYQSDLGSPVATTTKSVPSARPVQPANPVQPDVTTQPLAPPAASVPMVERPIVAESATTRATVPSMALEPRQTSLAEQAHELAQIKQLIDAGAAVGAVARLEASFQRDVHTALAEERDALYVQALERANRHALAQSSAAKFIAHYPKSPHVEKMRALLAEE